MKYLGGKAKVAKHVVEAINRYPFTAYYEPFLGGCNILPLIDAGVPRTGSDVNTDIILMYQGLRDGTFTPPQHVTEAEYKVLRHSEPSALRGFVGTTCSYSGRWFEGFARSKEGRSYAMNGYNSAMRLAPKLAGSEFLSCSYLDLEIKNGSMVYCDPPYKGVKGYGTKFDHDQFWEWVRLKSKTCTVLVSEYQAPPDFECIAEFSRNLEMKHSAKTALPTRIERIFKLKG